MTLSEEKLSQIKIGAAENERREVALLIEAVANKMLKDPDVEVRIQKFEEYSVLLKLLPYKAAIVDSLVSEHHRLYNTPAFVA